MADKQAFVRFLAPLRNRKWVVYCKRPFGGPKQVLRYLARYTHRVAISNRRLISCDDNGVTFKWKDYRCKGSERYQVMTLATNEFIRRFLIHVLPASFHRIRYKETAFPQAMASMAYRPRYRRRGNNLRSFHSLWVGKAGGKLLWTARQSCPCHQHRARTRTAHHPITPN